MVNPPVIGLQPSGDTSYGTDTERIQALLSQPVTCLLGPGRFYCRRASAPLAPAPP